MKRSLFLALAASAALLAPVLTSAQPQDTRPDPQDTSPDNDRDENR